MSWDSERIHTHYIQLAISGDRHIYVCIEAYYMSAIMAAFHTAHVSLSDPGPVQPLTRSSGQQIKLSNDRHGPKSRRGNSESYVATTAIIKVIACPILQLS